MIEILEVKDLSVNYGAINALKDVSISVHQGEIVTLIGSNGAGKSTLLKTISGLLKPASGDIIYHGNSLLKMDSGHIVSSGIVQVPEGRHVFPGMSVYENLMMGAYCRKDKENISKDIESIYERFPVLGERRNQDASTLSGGEQQELAMGRALMAKPQLLLLDEPSMGLAPILVQQIFDIIKQINEEGTTILLNEQNAMMALQIAHHGYVMENGRIVLSGTGGELLVSKEVQKAYLGG